MLNRKVQCSCYRKKFKKIANLSTTLLLKNHCSIVWDIHSTKLALATLDKATQIGITLFAQGNQRKSSTVFIAVNFEKTSAMLYNFTLEKSI
jgi:hypothetical protein